MNKLLILLLPLLFNPFLIAENDPFEEINRVTFKVNKTLKIRHYLVHFG